MNGADKEFLFCSPHTAVMFLIKIKDFSFYGAKKERI